jgi:hypothetical protein
MICDNYPTQNQVVDRYGQVFDPGMINRSLGQSMNGINEDKHKKHDENACCHHPAAEFILINANKVIHQEEQQEIPRTNPVDSVLPSISRRCSAETKLSSLKIVDFFWFMGN